MARKHSRAMDYDMVPEVRGFYSGQPSVQSPASNAYRGHLIRLLLGDVEQLLGVPLTTDIILYFAPDVTARCGVDLDWINQRLASIRGGRGCGQSVFARLLPIFWRLPQWGWRASIPHPPRGLTAYAVGDLIYRDDGVAIPWPLGTGPTFRRPTKSTKPEAA